MYSFGSRSGQIGKYTDDYFICVPYQWDFGKRAPVFTNAQKTADRIYLAFALDGKDYVLVYNLDNRRYKVVDYDDFPLGIIYFGCNYGYPQYVVGNRVNAMSDLCPNGRRTWLSFSLAAG